MNQTELEHDIKLKVVSTVNKTVMINVIKQRFLASSHSSSELSSIELSDLDGFSGDISKYKKDKIGLYGGVINGN